MEEELLKLIQLNRGIRMSKKRISFLLFLLLLIHPWFDAQAVKMNFPNTSLKKLVEHMNRITGRNFIFDPASLSGGTGGTSSRFRGATAGGPTITILAPEEMTVEEAYRVFFNGP